MTKLWQKITALLVLISAVGLAIYLLHPSEVEQPPQATQQPPDRRFGDGPAPKWITATDEMPSVAVFQEERPQQETTGPKVRLPDEPHKFFEADSDNPNVVYVREAGTGYQPPVEPKARNRRLSDKLLRPQPTAAGKRIAPNHQFTI